MTRTLCFVAALAGLAATLACSSPAGSPTSPSAAGDSAALGADGSP